VIGVVVDTSAYSAFRRGHQGVVPVLQADVPVVLTPIVLGELRAGFLLGTRATQNEALLQVFLAKVRVSLVDITEATATCFAAIRAGLVRAGTPLPMNDVWIAASAMEHGLRVLTLDAHFLKVPQVLVEYVGGAA